MLYGRCLSMGCWLVYIPAEANLIAHANFSGEGINIATVPRHGHPVLRVVLQPKHRLHARPYRDWEGPASSTSDCPAEAG